MLEVYGTTRQLVVCTTWLGPLHEVDKCNMIFLEPEFLSNQLWSSPLSQLKLVVDLYRWDSVGVEKPVASLKLSQEPVDREKHKMATDFFK